jgi:hypothetical protein
VPLAVRKGSAFPSKWKEFLGCASVEAQPQMEDR